MAQQNPPVQQLEFRGVYTAGNPIQRPRGTASKCQDFRVMPGFWLRTRGGRKYRNSTASAGQITYMKELPWTGSVLCQVKRAGNAMSWEWLATNFYNLIPATNGTISTAYDSSFAVTNPAAAAALRDRVVLYNGLGARDTDSKPPFITNLGRYFGLDAYCPSSNPTVAFAAGPGVNNVLTSVKIYVGLYHQPTAHYSNGVLAGTINATGAAAGTITVSNLTRLKAAYHDGAEQAELYYVFYATVDGYQVPYLILNSTLDGPYKVAVGTASASLSIAAGTINGWVLDTTKEMPQENYPPRPMKSLCFVRDRLFGVPMDAGYGSAVLQTAPGSDVARPDFQYQPGWQDLSSVVYSRNAGDLASVGVPGDPLQSWPLVNTTRCPSFEQPVSVWPVIDGVRVLVHTLTSTFLLEESVDGLMEWTTVSRTHGLRNPATLKNTDYGTIWVDQRNQFVCLPPNSTQIQILSQPYQSLITADPVCADYLVNPPDDIDRYEVTLADNTAVCHDFALPAMPSPDVDLALTVPGQAYSSTGRNYTAACTVQDGFGKVFHFVANTNVFTQERQPDTGTIPTTDENADSTTTEITGEYHRNWDDFGDSNVRKELPQVDVVGDGANSPTLQDSPLTVEWYGDFEEVKAENKKAVTLQKAAQSMTDAQYSGKPVNANRFWYRLVLKLRGHSADAADFATHGDPANQGDYGRNFYGSILRFMVNLGARTNRV